MAKRRRRSSIADALNAFSSTYKMTRGVMQDRDMAQVADAKVEEDTGFVAEQGAQLEAAANAKDENGNPFYNVEATEDGKYMVTPNKATFEARGASEDLTNSTANIDPGQRYSLLGAMQDKPFTEDQQDSMRTRAMAGVFSKYGDPVKALDMRQKAGQIDAQAQQAKLAEQGLQLGNLQVEQAKRANAAGERQDAVTSELTQAAQAQAKAAESSGDYAGYQSSMAKVVADKGVEGMVRANAGPGATESEIQQAITAYKQSIGDANANQNASSMKALYEHQGQIWNGVGGDPVKAAAAYRMAEAEGMPKVIESLKRGDVDGANKIWNSSGQGKGIITEVGKDKNGNLHAKVVDPFSGQSSTVNVSDMERQLLSLKDQLGMKKDEANIEQSQAAIRQGDARVTEERRHNIASEGIATKNADKVSKSSNPAAVQTAEWLVARGVAKDEKAAWEMLGESKSKSREAAIIDLAGKISSGGMVRMEEAIVQATTAVDSVRPQADKAGPAVGTRRVINGQNAEWDGKGWKAVR